MTPFLLRRLILFVQYQEEDTAYGITLVVAMVLIQGMNLLVVENISFYSQIIGVVSTNALVALIFDKITKISSATNKKFDQGELINFIQVDAKKLIDCSSQVG